jgi:hypothetical protein
MTDWDAELGGWVVAAQNMCGPGFAPTNLEVLWLTGKSRTNPVLIPGVAGRKLLTQMPDSMTVDVIMSVWGDRLQSGASAPSRVKGLASNLATLSAVVGGAPRTSVLTLPSGATKTAKVTIQAQPPQRDQTRLLVVLNVTMELGAHV